MHGAEHSGERWSASPLAEGRSIDQAAALTAPGRGVGPVMRTTRHLQQEIARINRLIARIKAKPESEWPIWASTLHELMEEREVLGLVMLNRQVEGQKKVVSFRRWRDGPWTGGAGTETQAAGGGR